MWEVRHTHTHTHLLSLCCVVLCVVIGANLVPVLSVGGHVCVVTFLDLLHPHTLTLTLVFCW